MLIVESQWIKAKNRKKKKIKTEKIDCGAALNQNQNKKKL